MPWFADTIRRLSTLPAMPRSGRR